MLIAFEGPNGVGKSSLIQYIKSYIDVYEDVKMFDYYKFPDKETETGRFIYKLLFENADQNAIAHLFVNERLLVANELENLKYSRHIGLIDRYSPSNVNTLLAKELIKVTNGKTPLFTIEQYNLPNFDYWFDMIYPEIVESVYNELKRFEIMEQDLRVIQPNAYVLFVPKLNKQTLLSIYARTSTKAKDSHERFDQFVLSNYVYRYIAERNMFSKWEVIEIDETTTLETMYNQFKSVANNLGFMRNFSNPCSEIIYEFK